MGEVDVGRPEGFRLREIPEAYLLVREKIRELLAGDSPRILAAIDGRCGSGKTTLAAWLMEQFDGNLFHMDDFYLREEQRTPERLAEDGGNVDYERFREEVTDPLTSGREVLYRRFDCGSFSLQDPERIPRKRLNVIEGSYSMHPYFGDIYDLRVFMTVSKEEQRERIRKRNGEEKLQRFLGEWIPKEEAYFRKFHPEQGALVISGE
ncbi:MAG: hypothetical protein IJT43_05655 [Stomatobaculum sp.]|nr:hypothetical protein [Stomatobaculum sp.]